MVDIVVGVEVQVLKVETRADVDVKVNIPLSMCVRPVVTDELTIVRVPVWACVLDDIPGGPDVDKPPVPTDVVIVVIAAELDDVSTPSPPPPAKVLL